MAVRSEGSRMVHAALTSSSWFVRLPEKVRADIVSRSRVRILSDGERIFSRGETPDGIYVVVKGSVRVSGVTREGRETVLDFFGPGFWFGEVSALDGRVRQHDAHAKGATVLAHLATAELEDLLAKHAAFSRALLKLEAERLRILLAAIETYSAQTMEQRLASRLLMLAEHHGSMSPAGVEIGLDLSHETLARLIGSSRQRVNHILNAWKRSATVEHHYGRIVLLDRKTLEKLAHL